MLAAIGKSRKDANKIKREEPITVVVGNPPYKEKAKGRGGWVEQGNPNAEQRPPLEAWKAPAKWGVSTHSKHLRNLYVYFWRWATWKVFDHHPDHSNGIVCFITMAGFLGGPGFQKMRDYLRRTCDDIWVIDCSPDGHRPPVNTRIFQGVKQNVCIVMASRSKKKDPNIPASVRFRALPLGRRETKFDALKKIRVSDAEWADCPSDWRAPFLPVSQGAWSTFPALDSLFAYNGSGVMPGRTWIIAPDSKSLEARWQKLKSVSVNAMDDLFQPHMDGEELGDRHCNKVLKDALHSFPVRTKSIADDSLPIISPIAYGFRSFDRQWIIPDKRVINRPNPELWAVRSDEQIYLTAPSDRSPSNGPALTLTALIPDLHHYAGRGGRAFPLWADDGASKPNLPPCLLSVLIAKHGKPVIAGDFMAYIAALAAHSGFTAKFQSDLSTPGLRIPITGDAILFNDVVELGRRIIWLHTFGERMGDASQGRPAGPPRMAPGCAPRIPKEGSVSDSPAAMPDNIEYDASKQRLLVGHGFIDNVPLAVWQYEISGNQILAQWFSYRRLHRERPIIGDRRPPSPLGDIQPDHWLPEYTTELLNVLNVLGLLVDLEPKQVELLDKVCAGPLISESELKAAGALDVPKPEKKPKGKAKEKPLQLFTAD